MVLFDMHSIPCELVIRFPPDVPFTGAQDRIGTIFHTHCDNTSSKTLAHSPGRSLRERVAQIDYEYAFSSQCAIAVLRLVVRSRRQRHCLYRLKDDLAAQVGGLP
jgi:hypothetical protein